MPTVRGGGKLTWSAFERRISNGRPACDLSDLRFVDAWGLVASACSLLEGPAEIARFGSPSAESSRRHLTGMGLTRFLDDIGVAHALPAGPAIDAPDVLVPSNGSTAGRPSASRTCCGSSSKAGPILTSWRGQPRD